MRAIVHARYGPPEVLRLADVPAPVPRDDELLIRVHAAEATKADCEMRGFRFSVRWFWLPLRLALGLRAPRRRILGSYIAGEVAAVGRAVTRFAAGDQVFGTVGLRMGGYAEYLTVPESATLVEKPRNMTFAEAAAVPMGGLNALHFMRLARIRPGERVLVIGAGGSIGAHAVQIAKTMGAEVIAVDRDSKAPLLRRLGADRCLDFTREDPLAEPAGYDVVFDMIPGRSLRTALRALRPHGRYLHGNPQLSLLLRAPLVGRFTDKTASCAFARETREELQALKAMVEDGTVVSIVDQVLPMTAAPAAHRLVETETRRGAIVLTMGPAAG